MCFRASGHGVLRFLDLRNTLTHDMRFWFDTLVKANEMRQVQGLRSIYRLEWYGTRWFKGNRQGKLYMIGSYY